MKIEIKRVSTGAVLWAGEAESLYAAVINAVKDGASLDGASLDDPQGLLEGEGRQVRGIRLKTPADLDSPAVAGLIVQAIAPHRDALAAAAPLATVIKAEVAKQRPRRPASTKP